MLLTEVRTFIFKQVSFKYTIRPNTIRLVANFILTFKIEWRAIEMLFNQSSL